jgi:hypothetical protein
MELTEYFENNFWQNLSLIPTNKPNDTILENPNDFYLDINDTFFGDREWGNYDSDISGIHQEQMDDFVLCLFVSLTMDYYIKINYIRPELNYIKPLPKLGWSGYGPHFEHPLLILLKHFENLDLDSIFLNRKEEILDLMIYFVRKYTLHDFDEVSNLIKNDISDIPTKFNHPVFFEFLTPNEEEIWFRLMKIIFE